MSNESAESFDNQKLLEILKSSRVNVNWKIADERCKFIHEVYPSIEPWDEYILDDTEGPPPNIQDVFRSEEIECLAMDYVNFVDKDKEYVIKLDEFIRFVAYSGYKDEPKLNGEGKPSSRRTTPVHHAAKQDRDLLSQLFQIYNRYDVNYTDESGLSHFHVACLYGFDDEIKKFLELGQDPNCLRPETGDSPLHLYLIGGNEEMAEAMMRSSSCLNLANKDGLTPLHIISKKYDYDMSNPDVAKILFEISDEKQQPLSVDARDKLGNTPLHLAVLNENDHVTEILLRRGADPNSANDEGSTPLHEFYKRDTYFCDIEGSVELFFKICDEVNQSVQVDARDKLGRTPLQLAVANLCPDCIDILFERGADLSNFIFPTESYFGERYKSLIQPHNSSNDRLILASGALAAVENIVKRGYQLERSDAMMIMKCFAEYKLFEKSSDLEKCWYDDENFTMAAKKIRICPGISMLSYQNRTKIKTSPGLWLDEVVQLRPEEAAKLLTYEDYWKFACSENLEYFFDVCQEELNELSALHLCEKLSRGFFRSWALDSFWELIHHRLPLECCEMIIEHLSNQDLCNICLAAEGQIS